MAPTLKAQMTRSSHGGVCRCCCHHVDSCAPCRLQVAVVAAAVAALLALPIEREPIVQTAPFVTLTDGRNISYELRGDAASTYTLLYLHR